MPTTHLINQHNPSTVSQIHDTNETAGTRETTRIDNQRVTRLRETVWDKWDKKVKK